MKKERKQERIDFSSFARVDKTARERERSSVLISIHCTICSHLSHRCQVVFNLLCLWHLVELEPLPFETVISFGDWITDTGNVYQLTNHSWPLVPPYYRGRFSDGPVSIERLGVTNLHNYAHGGATSDNALVQGYSASGTVPVPGARQQIHL